MKESTGRGQWRLWAVLGLTMAGLVGCQTAYYKVWETFGREKRHLLKSAVADVQDEQTETSEDFEDALTRLRKLYDIKGGELESFYDKLNGDYEACREGADRVHGQIAQMDRVATDLFVEWDREIEEITNTRLAMDSRRKLGETRRNYGVLKRTLDEASGRMDRVLPKLRDQVLYMKHNLNAQAIGAMRTEADSIIGEIGMLIDEMNRSIAEAEAFAKTL